MNKPKKPALAPRVHPTPSSRTDFGDAPLKYETYKPSAEIPMRAGSMDAYQLPSVEFGQRKAV